MTEVIRRDRTSSLKCRPARSALQARAGRPVTKLMSMCLLFGVAWGNLAAADELSRATAAAGFLRMGWSPQTKRSNFPQERPP
jgi:hypothetical protein